MKRQTEPKVKPAACPCLILFQNNTQLSTLSVSFYNTQCQPAGRAKYSRAVDERSVGRSVAESSRAESSQRSETKRVGSENFFSLSLERQRSAGKMDCRCRYTLPSVFDRHQHFFKIRSSFGLVLRIYDSVQMGRGRQTEPELKRRGPTRVRVLMHKCISHMRPSSE